MTVENCIKLLKKFKELSENPTGNDENERIAVRDRNTLAYLDMKKHILNSKKFIGHDIISELQDKPKETKTDGKKSKR